MINITENNDISRRHLLQVSAAGVVSAVAFGGSMLLPTTVKAEPYKRDFIWTSPRGTIEVVDDYPYWIAKEMGYFGDLKTTMQPGPSDGASTVKLVATDQADMGFPSPGVLSYAINNKMDLVSIYGSGSYDLFNFAFRKGQGVKDLKQLVGKTILLGSSAWQSICDPMFAAAGVDPKSINYLDVGWPTWGTTLASGQGDACLAWEGLRADWDSKGLKFDYWLGRRGSPLPSNSLVVRRSDINDPERKVFLKKYLKGWAMGSEFAEHNPRAATEIVFKSLPTRILKQLLGAKAGVTSLMQIHQTFKGDMSKRAGWGEHDLVQWELFFKTLKRIGQSNINIDTNKIVLNDFIAEANNFDRSKVKADADAYPLPYYMRVLDMEAIKTSFFANVIN
jgi:NitT/TauT family transport system substrate-binding protein